MQKIILCLLACTLAYNTLAQVHKYKSTSHDVEVNGITVRTIDDVCYHTFDFNNQTITFEGIDINGEKIKVTYHMKDFYQDGITTVIVINEKGVKEIWFSTAVNNLGYDFYNNIRLACYGLTKIY